MRLSTKVLLVFAAFALLLAFLMSAFTLQTKKLLQKKAEDNQRNIARVIHLSAQRLLSENVDDPQILKKITKEINHIEGVSEVTIIDKNQIVVASTNLNLEGQYHPFSSMELEINKKPENKKEIGEYSSFEIGIPVMQNQQIIGMVRTTVSLKDVRHPLQLLYIKNIAIILGILLIGFGISFLIIRRLNQPLKQLTTAVEKISAGDLSVTVPCTTKDEIGRLADSFNRATEKLAEQKQLEARVHQLERSVIVAELSSCLTHEIRNPLNLIMLTASHLGNQFLPEDQDQQKKYKEYITSLKAEVKHLNKMVGNFLSMGKSSKLSKSKFKLSAFMKRIQVLVKQQLLSKNIGLEISGDSNFELFADEERMQVVFLNLIINAIDVVPPNGLIEVTVRKMDDTKEDLLSITDNGKGIKSENIENIFEPYVTEKADGIGIGLAVVKRIVEEHDGQISACNAENGGARFEIILPWEDI
jgi:nitrogen fixation/metabolism regulation signal transduction histidine kinase